MQEGEGAESDADDKEHDEQIKMGSSGPAKGCGASQQQEQVHTASNAED
jgi:hypothetical protein